MKKCISRRLAALLLALALMFSSAAAYSSDYVETKFDFVLWQIEANSLFTEDKEMPEAERAEINAYLEQHPEDLERIVNEYLATLDTHSMYLTNTEYEQGFSTLTGYVGIGVGVQMTPQGVVISEVFRSGPAAEAGVRVGDRITAVDGTDVTAFSSSELAVLLRGEEGTSLQMVVDRDGQSLTFTVMRRHINQDYVSARTVADGVEYIRIEAIGSMGDLDSFREIWEGLAAKNTRAVILDLRGNGGGLVDAAQGMVDIMIEKEGVYLGALRWRSDNGGTQKQYSTGGGLPLNKICILTDQNTASAAELITGTMKEAAGATVIGENSYGKGQGQYHLTMLDGSRLVITCMEMLLPQTGGYEGVGITPDIKITDDPTVASYLAGQPALDQAQTLWYGQQSEKVRALSSRLFVLGYGASASDVFDTTLLSALRQYQKAKGLTPRVCADRDTLSALQQDMAVLTDGDYRLDTAYYTAVDLCRQAAAQPQRYKVRESGAWYQ